MMAGPLVVAWRVDALKLAYRVELSPALVHYLKHRQRIASKHGSASVRWGPIIGLMRFSATPGTWHIMTERYQLHIWAKGPGADVTPEGEVRAGWTVEIVWAAQELANMPHTGPAVEDGRRVALELGALLASRVRRFDLCADVANWQIEAGDAERLVRRSRAKLDLHGIDVDEETATQVHELLRMGKVKEAVDAIERTAHVRVHEISQRITGITVCPGGNLMARIYDKRQELAVRRVTAKTEAEEARWREGGWDGKSPVMRVEFQLQGEVVGELGLRDPDAPIHPKTGAVIAGALHERIDDVWQRCLLWLKLVKLTKSRRSECPLDPVWVALREVKFVRTGFAALRFRVRRRASVEQTLGCALSVVGATNGLEAVRPWRASSIPEPDVVLKKHVRGIFERAAAVVVDELSLKWKGPAKALEHVLEVHDARRALYGDQIVASSRATTFSEPVAIASG